MLESPGEGSIQENGRKQAPPIVELNGIYNISIMGMRINYLAFAFYLKWSLSDLSLKPRNLS